MNIEKIVDKIAKRSEQKMVKDDYTVDGLIYCGKCNTPKQCRIMLFGNVRVIGCLCECENRKREDEIERRRKEEERIEIDMLRVSGISDRGLRDCRFENAETSGTIEKCMKYAKNWDDAYKNNIGVLLWGDTGRGKTFAAACIANYLIDSGIPAMITSFPRILAAKYSEREDLLYKISKFPALVIDDLGAERGTEAALETVYAVIDERYKSGKPLIATTNLSLEQIKHPGDVAHKRIYERVLEMCTPIFVDGKTYRSDSAKKKIEIAKKIFS